MVVNLIGGPADGMKYEYFTIPDVIKVSCSPVFTMKYFMEHDDSDEIAILEAVYKRIGDTLEFICISEPSNL